MNTPNKQRKASVKPKGFKINYGDLAMTGLGIAKVKTELPVVYNVASFEFDRWLRNNEKELDLYREKRLAIDYKNFKHTMNGDVPAYEKSDGNLVFKDGCNEESYQKECDELNKTLCTVYP